MYCPICGSKVHRSHTRGAGEMMRKALMGYKAYRCSHCGWREMVGRQEEKRPAPGRMIRIAAWVAAVIIGLLIARYASSGLDQIPSAKQAQGITEAPQAQ